MSVLPIIKAPLGVQLNRVAFAIYAVFFGWPMWNLRHAMVPSGWVIFSSFVFCSLLGFAYTFIRVRWSRWILAVLGLLIPAVFWAGICLMGIFSRPAWWEWPLAFLLSLVALLGIPIMLAVLLFRDKKTSEYFTTTAA
jgi:hypothetical protein